MSRIDDLKSEYDQCASVCADLAQRVPENEKTAITNKTKLDLSPNGQKLRDAIERKRIAATALHGAIGQLQSEAAAMLSQADQISEACQAILRGDSLSLPAWPKPARATRELAESAK